MNDASSEQIREAVAPDMDRVAPTAAGSPLAAVTLGVAALAFVVLTMTLGARGGRPPRVDTAVHSWVLHHRGAADLRLARAVTWGGVTEVVVPLLVVLGTLAARPRTWLLRLQSGLLATCVASAGMYVGLLINHAVDRARPDRQDWAGSAGGPAFPSGHTTAATVFACALAWVVLDRLRDRRARWAATGAAVLWAGAVGWSRLWLGVHWPTDVLGGWLFGSAWSAAAIAVVGAVRRRRHRDRSPARTAGPDPTSKG
jgi:membrane-associated phospholipid phosphatase